MTGKNLERHGYTVTYESSSHVGVLLQRAGSVWPRVFPYCVFNCCLAALIQWLKARKGIDLEISSTGHGFINLLVAFLIVSRVNISIGRYNEARGYLGIMYRETRELLQNMVVFSEDQREPGAKEWRLDVCYRSMLLLRTAMAVIDYSTDRVPAWELNEIRREEQLAIQRNLYIQTTDNAGANAMRWAHETRTEFEENMRVPIGQAFKLRQAIFNQYKTLPTPLPDAQVNKLLGSVDSFMAGYYGMRKFLTTPFPFPLVQMARTFLFFYVFSVPFVLASDDSSMVAHVAVIFILTYGFMGLEYVSIELDNPFGDDDNDFDNLAMCYTAFEDTYLLITEVDGYELADQLRSMMSSKKDMDGNATESTGLLAA